MIKAIDLFAGAGGLSYGFLMTGKYELKAAAEINKNARETYKKNIVQDQSDFEFIQNVVGYDFEELNKKIEGGIDVVIGGPPCQGFSNANRQKNHLISMNNSLVKDYFRAIRQIKPKAFVMENVSMLSSDKHRFYESTRDNQEIDALIEQGYDIPKRSDSLLLSASCFDGVDMTEIPQMDFGQFRLPEDLNHMLSVLKKDIGNPRRLPNFLKKNSDIIIRKMKEWGEKHDEQTGELNRQLISKLNAVVEAISEGEPERTSDDLAYVVEFQKMIEFIDEIKSNGLIGDFVTSETGELRFNVNSYAVIDYVNAVLGGLYVQVGDTVNAEWFGVPQERKRYFVVGIRKDIYEKSRKELKLPKKPDGLKVNTVSDAIKDLEQYDAEYEPDSQPIPYKNQEDLSEYAKGMRKGSCCIRNHITTRTTEKALSRFRKIEQGKNFHSLDISDKDTYSKPDRTQNTIYLRLDPSSPSGTVMNVRKSMWIHPVLDRAITVREAARLQSFPDRFEFKGTKDSQYQQVGNAVPPLLAKAIAEIVAAFIE